MVDQLWNKTRPRASIEHRLKRCNEGLPKWSSKKHRRYLTKIHALTEHLQVLQDNEDQVAIREIKVLQRELKKILQQEKIRWKKHAKRHWYHEGDWNIQFFHACAIQRKKKNFI